MTPGARFLKRFLLVGMLGATGSLAGAQSPTASHGSASSLAERVQRVTSRPEFRHSNFGIAFLSLDDGSVIYEQSSDKFFVPGSTTKLLTEGTALELLGAGYRFHTRVYRTGTIAADGTLTGDLVLVASGDPNLSNRIRSGGKLAFENHDHAYGGSPDTRAVAGDPLAVICDLAKQLVRKGVKRVRGRVLVDISLYPEGDRDGGTGVVISPVIVNDNVLDMTVGPGEAVGSAATLRIAPQTSYATFVNKVVTGSAGSAASMDFDEVANPDRTQVVTMTGSVARVRGGLEEAGRYWLAGPVVLATRGGERATLYSRWPGLGASGATTSRRASIAR